MHARKEGRKAGRQEGRKAVYIYISATLSPIRVAGSAAGIL